MTVENVDADRLTLKPLSNRTLTFVLSKLSNPLTVSPSIDPSGGMMARGWGVGPTGVQEYGRGFGGVFILTGRGVGQSRRVLGLLADRRTLLLDRSWGVEPDTDSVLVLFSESAHSVTIRDNTMIGISKHVDQEAHTASTMIPLWGRADRFLYSGNSGTDMRTTMYSMVATNLTVTDHAIVNSVSIHTRLGLELSITPSATKLTNLWTIDGMIMRNVVVSAVSVLPHCYTRPDCTGAPAGAAAISNLSVSDAAVGVAIYHDGWTEGAPSSFNWTGSGLGALILRNFTFDTGARARELAIASPGQKFGHRFRYSGLSHVCIAQVELVCWRMTNLWEWPLRTAASATSRSRSPVLPRPTSPPSHVCSRRLRQKPVSVPANGL